MKKTKVETPEVNFALFETDWGPAGIAWTDKGLYGLVLPGLDLEELRRQARKLAPSARPAAKVRMEKAIRDVQAYFRGETLSLDADFDLSWATPFQVKVYRALCAIPPGETRSYAEIAKAAGKPGAARAVGMANAANRLPLFIPCHRVVNADGCLGGFSGPGGVKMKERLLQLEKKATGKKL